MSYRKSKVYLVDDEEFVSIIDSSNSYSDALRKIGLSTIGGASVSVLKERIDELNLDISHFHKGKNGSYTKYDDIHSILVENSPYKNTSSLKSRLLKENLLEYKCNECGIIDWNSSYISLQLDHINGINTDNRLENLRLLCPNCHSQTHTYAGRNKSK